MNGSNSEKFDELRKVIQKRIDDANVAKNVNQTKLKELAETCNSYPSDIAVCNLFIEIFFSHTN